MQKIIRQKLFVIGIFFFCLIGLSVLFVQSVKAQEYNLYVDLNNTTGVEDGTQANPFITITKALEQAKAGDTVYILKGEYQEELNVPNQVSLIGESQEGVVINGGFHGTVVFLNHQTSLYRLTIKGGRYGIEVPVKAGVKVTEVTIRDAKEAGVILKGDKETRYNKVYERIFEKCIIKNNQKGMYIKQSRFSVKKSDIIDNKEEGIDVRESSRGTIKGNVFKNNGEGNMELVLDSSKIKVIDNKIKGAGASGIALQYYLGKKGNILILKNQIVKSHNYAIKCDVKGDVPKQGWAKSFVLKSNKLTGNKKGRYTSECDKSDKKKEKDKNTK